MTAPITWENGTANAGKPMDAQTVETTGDVLNDADHRQAEAMVARYEYRVSLHAGTGQATGRQRVEVKNLAHQTSKATEEISTQVANIQGITSETRAAIDDISNTLSEISAIMSGIEVDTAQQRNSTQDISKSVQDAARGTLEVSNHIGQITLTSAETGRMASEARDAAAQLRRDVEPQIRVRERHAGHVARARRADRNGRRARPRQHRMRGRFEPRAPRRSGGTRRCGGSGARQRSRDAGRDGGTAGSTHSGIRDAHKMLLERHV